MSHKTEQNFKYHHNSQPTMKLSVNKNNKSCKCGGLSGYFCYVYLFDLNF